jgi:hypothetical protein
MKKQVRSLGMAALVAVLMTSCYSLSYTVGNGSQTGVEVTGKNHYVIGGLVGIKKSDVKELSGGAANYDITVVHTFIDGLLSAITGGIYTPTTTIVKK